MERRIEYLMAGDTFEFDHLQEVVRFLSGDPARQRDFCKRYVFLAENEYDVTRALEVFWWLHECHMVVVEAIMAVIRGQAGLEQHDGHALRALGCVTGVIDVATLARIVPELASDDRILSYVNGVFCNVSYFPANTRDERLRFVFALPVPAASVHRRTLLSSVVDTGMINEAIYLACLDREFPTYARVLMLLALVELKQERYRSFQQHAVELSQVSKTSAWFLKEYVSTYCNPAYISHTMPFSPSVMKALLDDREAD
jgi:hypothetical protein